MVRREMYRSVLPSTRQSLLVAVPMLAIAATPGVSANPVGNPSDTPQLAQASQNQPDGVWRGYLIKDVDAACGRGFGRPRLVRVKIDGGEISGTVGHLDQRWPFKDRLGDKATVSLWMPFEIMHPNSTRYSAGLKLQGQFQSDQFEGQFYAQRGSAVCSGRLVLARRGTDAHKQMIAAVLGRVAPRRRQIAEAPPAEAPAKTRPPLPSPRAPQTRDPAAPAVVVAPPPPAAVPGSLEAELATLKRLLERRLINRDQFDTRQQALLDRQFGAVPARQTASVPFKPKIPPGINFGNYHALVIGINQYKNLARLKTAEADARAMATVLKENYGFKVQLLLNPTRSEIVDSLDDLRASLTNKDNLLIYYAGHGWLDEKADEGYWLPVDAKSNRRSNWVSNATLTNTLRSLEAKHVMVVADSCYSGRLVRSAKITLGDPNYLRTMSRKKARVVLTSGSLEPVADNNGSGHSPFTDALLDALRNNQSVLDGSSLFNKIRRPVVVNANQTPQFSDVRQAGHDGGDFLFVRRR